MFQKDRSSTFGGKKDAPLRKSDRRRLRDRAVDALFIGGNDGSSDGVEQEEWIARAEKLLDDAIVAPKGGDVLSRKLKLAGGEHATLFLRTPSTGAPPSDSSVNATNSSNLSYDDIMKSFPTMWPYHRSTQPILLEYEDNDRKVHLIPLLPLLAALPPPMPSPPLRKTTPATTEATSASTTESTNNKDDNEERKYRIPNIAVHAEVSKYLCRGADLMRSGIRSFPTPWTLRQSKGLVSISIIGNPQVVAIGRVDATLFRDYCYPKNGKRNNNTNGNEAAVDLTGPGKKGVGVMIVNCYGDDLWKNGLPPKSARNSGGAAVGNPLGGGNYDDGNFGNLGFVDGARVHPILEFQSVDDSDDDEESGYDENADEGDNGNVDEGTSEGAASEMAQLNLSEQSKVQPDEQGPAPVDHDGILTKAFYASLLQLLCSKTPLPMPVSTYYAKHLLAAVPITSGESRRLDMKQTSYKKIGPFLKEMQSDGVITCGASKDGKDKCAFLTGIVKNNPDLVRFKREWKKEMEANGGGDLSMAGAGATPQKTKLAVVDLYIVPRHISDGLQLDRDAVMATNAKTDERKGTGFLTKTECRALIENYIEKESLVDPNGKGRVLVNGPLCDALYRVSKKNKQPTPTEYPTSVKRKELIEKWMERMDSGHALVQMPGSKILNLGRGAPKPVDIEVEFRQGNRRKFLTRIRGMEEYGIDGAALSQDVSHRFACSSSIETAPVGRPALKKGRVELVFQGHLSEELTALLTGDAKISSHGGAKGSDYHLPKSVINVVLRKGVSARKKR
mmetsp:Transcript_27557/g.58229  ORF Transcript_27557/g.58229 Transcript_27557/m.58229 type:complete len:788 (-) Transcript_27557:59-2422(-)|eukprot:CAMPEP_0183730494 /NCGR_PEP_ID=MMETSP0737-20130205/32990_1 /TAXON_ID=385413 /ORGANISM="Thalassiosira miniscula, Strain CCMP1093" /LENGTH=787 /DNA_ID=CAMNT_0025963013 /DNA_START=55 /DNA_END=2418 /DNA_ORIENTATION=+